MVYAALEAPERGAAEVTITPTLPIPGRPMGKACLSELGTAAFVTFRLAKDG